MTIKENPFYILGATPRDNRQKIQELVDEKSLSLDMNVCVEARSILTNPRRRLAAELSWLPGVSIKQMKTVVKELDSKELDPETLEHLPSLAGFNAILGYLTSGAKLTLKDQENIIFALAQNYDAVKPESIMKIINEDRAISGFPEVTELSVVQDEIAELKNSAMHSLQEMFSTVSLSQQNKITLNLMGRCEKEKKNYELIDDVIDNIYALEVQKNIESIRAKVENAIKEVEKASTSKSKIAAAVDNLISELKDFDDIMQPIQLSTQKRGLEHDITRDIAIQVRKVCLLLGKRDMLNYAEKITEAMNDYFREVDSIESLTSKDLEQIKQIRKTEKEHEKAIECKIYHTTFSGTKTLAISSKGVSFGEQSYKLEEITNIRYGVKLDQNRNLRSFVAFGTDEEEIQIKWLQASLYGDCDYLKFTGCLWKAVGVRILKAMVAQLALGKSIYGFIYDTKVELENTYSFGKDTKTCKWSEVSVKSEGGNLIIYETAHPAYEHQLSFMSVENAVVLSVLLKLFKEDVNAKSISESFGISKEDAKFEPKISFPDEVQNRGEPSFIDWGGVFAATWWIWIWLIIGLIAAIAD